MKLIKCIILSLTVILVSSCSDWLDVQPTTEKDRQDLITTSNGYKQMLFGTYINMVKTSLYGNNLSYGFLEILARNYCDINLTSAGNYAYTDNSIRGYCDNIWSSMYNNIANINSILKDVDKHQKLFSQNEYQLLSGEAYAMRAYMHFDLLRMFAPRYVGNEDVIAIPYVDTYEQVRHPHLSEATVMKKIIKDLDKADSLFLEAHDPIIKDMQTITYNGNGEFSANRQYRFNYWTVQALKARVYLYMGDTDKALSFANKIIEESPFTWTEESTISSGDKIFQNELITGLDAPNLPDYYDSFFGSAKYTLGSQGWSGIINWGTNVFEDANDYRYLYLFGNDKENNKIIPQKYKQEIGTNKTMKKQTIPLVRLGEMYLISAECQVASNPQNAIALLRELKLHRGYFSEGQGISSTANTAQLIDYIYKELRKETYAEGQIWFYYKRIDSKTTPNYSTWAPTFSMVTDNYTFPIPEDEKEYGYIPSTRNCINK